MSADLICLIYFICLIDLMRAMRVRGGSVENFSATLFSSLRFDALFAWRIPLLGPLSQFQNLFGNDEARFSKGLFPTLPNYTSAALSGIIPLVNFLLHFSPTWPIFPVKMRSFPSRNSFHPFFEIRGDRGKTGCRGKTG